MKSRSWKTTTAAVAALLAAGATAVAAMFDEDPATVADWGLVMAAVAASIGLFMAKDASAR